MKKCWKFNPKDRPTFEEICELLDIGEQQLKGAATTTKAKKKNTSQASYGITPMNEKPMNPYALSPKLYDEIPRNGDMSDSNDDTEQYRGAHGHSDTDNDSDTGSDSDNDGESGSESSEESDSNSNSSGSSNNNSSTPLYQNTPHKGRR